MWEANNFKMELLNFNDPECSGGISPCIHVMCYCCIEYNQSIANTTIYTVMKFKGDGWSTGEKNNITINSFPLKHLQTIAGWVLFSSALLCYAGWNTDTKTELLNVEIRVRVMF